MSLNLGIIASGRTASGGGGGVDADAQAFFDRVNAAGGTLTNLEKSAVNTLTLSLKSSGLWTLMNVIYPMVGSSAAACSQNLRSSSFTGSFINAWTFSTTGANPNGIDAYMNTNLNIGSILTQTNSHAAFYSRSSFDNVNYPTVIGGYGTALYTQALELYIRRQLPGDKGGGDIGSYTTSVINFTETDARKFAIISRTSATSLKYYTNGILRATDTTSDTTGFGNVTAYISAGNYVTGVAQNFSRLECAFATLGNGLTDLQSLDFYNIVQTFQTTLSRQV
jgi:hypothetical protein